jgi:uncharacterized membrane protein YedE/YeeE
MSTLLSILRDPWPWYVAGPLIGLMVPVLLLLGNRSLGISSNFRHLCAIAAPGASSFLRYDWRSAGGWNLAFLAGVTASGALAAALAGDVHVAISPETREALAALGVTDTAGWLPASLYSWDALLSGRGLVLIVAGGFLVGFGTAWAGGCTSGHGVTGLAALELPSFIAVCGFFAGGLVGTHLLLPVILR